MSDLNEAGLSAAEATMMNEVATTVAGEERATEVTRSIIESYFEHAEVDTKQRLHPTNRAGHLSGRTHKFEVGGVEGYITVNEFADGRPGEVFLHGVGKEGSTVTGLMDLVAILISVALQYGVPIKQITKFMIGMDFEPKDSEHSSLPDYIGTYLEETYGPTSTDSI